MIFKRIAVAVLAAAAFFTSSFANAEKPKVGIDKLWLVQLDDCMGRCPGETRAQCYIRCADTADREEDECMESPNVSQRGACARAAFMRGVRCRWACASTPLGTDDGI